MKNIKNERAVSPVIGVILMVVITVIIAAVLAVFAFGVGAPSKSPTASIKITSVDSTNDVITVQHYGGDTLRMRDVKLTVESLNADGVILATATFDLATTATGLFSAGDSIAIDTTAGGLSLSLNGAAVAAADLVAAGGVDVNAAGIDSVRVTVIDTPSGSVLSKPSVKVT